MVKRSEVLDQITEHFWQNKRKGRSDKEALDSVLSFLQEIGMEPPRALITKTIDYELFSYIIEESVNEWEDNIQDKNE